MSSLYRSTVGRAIFAAAVFVPGLVFAQAGGTDPEAVLKDAAAALAKHPTFRLDASVMYRGKFQGSEEELTTNFTIALERPDRISVHVENAQNEVFSYGDGKDYTRYIPYYKQFVIAPQTMSTQEIVAMSGFELIDPAVRAIAALTTADPFSGPLAPQSPKFIGREDVNGHACDRIHFATADRTYDVWVEAAPARLVRRIEPEMTPEEKKFAADYGTSFDFTLIATFETWDFDADVASLLQFTAPDGVEKVSAFMPPRRVTAAEKMAGLPAPDFTLPLLGGGELALAKQKGHIVILEFWATWCGPCRQGLPVMQQIAGEYAQKGVKVFAINGGEDRESVKAFLAQAGLDKLTVALDADDSVTAMYQAESIPQTVFIRPDGVIHSVHIGIPNDPAVTGAASSQEDFDRLFREGYAKTLRAELDALIQAGTAPAK